MSGSGGEGHEWKWHRTVVDACPNRIQRLTSGQSEIQTVDVHFSADVPRSADKASVFVDAVSTEREAVSVDGLRKRVSV